MRKIRDEERKDWLMSYVMPEPNTGCWLWTGACNKKGYGITRNTLAHRASYRIFRGVIPDGMHVLHDCDTPGCVNPNHLHLGTDKDNAHERDARHRRHVPRGERNWGAKITDSQAREVQRLRASGMRLASIASTCGIHYSTITRILYAKGRFEDWQKTYFAGSKNMVGTQG